MRSGRFRLLISLLIAATASVLQAGSAWAAGPTIDSASVSPNPDTVGVHVTFSVGWTDPGATVKAVICKTNGVSAGVCTGDSWTSGQWTTANPATAAMTPFQDSVGDQTWYAFVCDTANLCSPSSSGTLTIVNRVPTLSSATATPAVLAGNNITFTANWVDPSDTDTALFCTTNALSGTACAGGTWASASSTTGTATATYTTTAADAGSHPFYAFVCDSTGVCTSSIAGTWAVWQVTLSASAQLATVGQSVTLTATTPANSGIANDYIEIFDLTTSARVAGCVGTSCTASVTSPVVDPINQSRTTTQAQHTYKAYVASTLTSTPPSTGILVQSGQVPVEWGAPAAITLVAAPPAQQTGGSATLTAAATRPAGDIGFLIEIYDQGTGQRVQSCTTGSTCSVDVASAVDATNTYVAYLAADSATAPPPNVQATSNTATVTWVTENPGT